MNINSRRLRTQFYFEELLGCTDPSQLKSLQNRVTQIVLNQRKADILREFCNLDAKSFLFKGAISLLSGVSGLSKGRQTWPVVQLYYANYYFLRAEILIIGRCILRANQVFTVLCRNGQRIEKVSNRKSKSDHDLSIFFAEKYLEGRDTLLTQNIDGQIPYKWLQEKRNWHQYKSVNYIEISDHGPFFPFEQIGLLDQIEMFIKDRDFYFCFDPDYAALALPLKRFEISILNAKEKGIIFAESERKILDRFHHEGQACQRILQILHQNLLE